MTPVASEPSASRTSPETSTSTTGHYAVGRAGRSHGRGPMSGGRGFSGQSRFRLPAATSPVIGSSSTRSRWSTGHVRYSSQWGQWRNGSWLKRHRRRGRAPRTGPQWSRSDGAPGRIAAQSVAASSSTPPPCVAGAVADPRSGRRSARACSSACWRRSWSDGCGAALAASRPPSLQWRSGTGWQRGDQREPESVASPRVADLLPAADRCRSDGRLRRLLPAA